MAEPEDPRVLQGKLRKRRGVSKASITRIASKVGDLEADITSTNKCNKAKQLLVRLNEANSSYRQCHLALL